MPVNIRKLMSTFISTKITLKKLYHHRCSAAKSGEQAGAYNQQKLYIKVNLN